MENELLLVLPMKVPGVNGKGGLKRESHFAYSRRRDVYTYQFKLQAKNRSFAGKVGIHITRYTAGGPEMDYDNLVGTYKPVLDAIVRAKIIGDDKNKVIVERKYEHVNACGETKTEIRIWPID